MAKMTDLVPCFEDLAATMSCYFDEDDGDIQDTINTNYDTSKGEMPAMMIRFFTSMIDAKASLFTKKFERVVAETLPFDIEDLDDELQWTERNLHCLKRAALAIEKDKEGYTFTSLDASEYFHYVSIRRGFEFWAIEIEAGEVTDVYIKYNKEDRVFACRLFAGLQDVCDSWDEDKDIEDNLEKYIEKNKYEAKYKDEDEELSDFPFVEWTYRKNRVAKPNSLVTLEHLRIMQLTWGFYNADPKLTTHPVVETGQSSEEVKADMTNFGKTRKMTRLTPGAKLSNFDPGDLKNLESVYDTWTGLLTQVALDNGVSKDSVVAGGSVKSGEALKVENQGVNEKRRKFISSAKKFDRAVFKVLEDVYGVNTGYERIVFRDITMLEDPMDIATYAVYLRDNGIFTEAEAHSYILEMPLEDAEQRVKDMNTATVLNINNDTATE